MLFNYFSSSLTLKKNKLERLFLVRYYSLAYHSKVYPLRSTLKLLAPKLTCRHGTRLSRDKHSSLFALASVKNIKLFHNLFTRIFLKRGISLSSYRLDFFAFYFHIWITISSSLRGSVSFGLQASRLTSFGLQPVCAVWLCCKTEQWAWQCYLL